MINILTGEGIDYKFGPHAMITFPAGVTRVPINISLTGDNTLEGIEHFGLTINSSSLPNNVTIGNPDTAVVTIVDRKGKYVSNKVYTYFFS